MNILFWILQVLLALHTAMGAVWKFSNPEQAVGSLSAIPHWFWIGISIVELAASLALVLVAFVRSFGRYVSWAATFIAAEMLLWIIVSLISSGTAAMSQIVYWFVVAVISGFLAYGRCKVLPFSGE